MNRFLLGTFLGFGVGYVVKKMIDEGYFDKLSDELNQCTSKAKRDMKNIVDQSINEAEYLKERAESVIQKGKDIIQQAANE